MDSHDHDQKEVEYQSADIVKKPKVEYFVKVKNKKPSIFGRFRQFLGNLKQKKSLKWFAIGGAALVITACVVLWITVWKPDAPVDVPAEPELAWSDQLSRIRGEANMILWSDSDKAFFDAVAFFDSKIETTDNPDHKFDLIVARAVFLADHGDTQNSWRSLWEVNENELTDEQKFTLFKAFRFIYERLGQLDNVKIYDDKINRLPYDITTEGGPANE